MGKAVCWNALLCSACTYHSLGMLLLPINLIVQLVLDSLFFPVYVHYEIMSLKVLFVLLENNLFEKMNRFFLLY
uniref:Uncharacterized protein n=1 Tax=Rhizophora mucronata TaxID=61149 RepID=A0A2P2QYY4_RHIMU